MTGIVFDIQKFALYDGPGIRTVVFLKGCPLKCAWCCNPESQSRQPQLSYNQEKCRHCFSCVPVCSSKAHKILDGKHRLDFGKCCAIGACVAECAYDALKIMGKRLESDLVLEQVIKDQAYFEKSGGGLTLSGGEPMMQFDFTLELLQKAKKRGLNTCVETCGYAPIHHFRQILPLVDHFLYDYKLTDNSLHQRYTGVPNDVI